MEAKKKKSIAVERETSDSTDDVVLLVAVELCTVALGCIVDSDTSSLGKGVSSGTIITVS